MTSKEWDLLQTLHVHTLLYTQVITGAKDRWKNAVMDICWDQWDMESLGELLHNLEFVERTVAPNTNATYLIMPSQVYMRHAISNVQTSGVLWLTGGIQGPRSRLGR